MTMLLLHSVQTMLLFLPPLASDAVGPQACRRFDALVAPQVHRQQHRPRNGKWCLLHCYYNKAMHSSVSLVWLPRFSRSPSLTLSLCLYLRHCRQ
jgi:hypothetical protein